MNKNQTLIWILVVIAVVVLLVFLTMHGKKEDVSLQNNTSNENTGVVMEQNINIEGVDPTKLKIIVTKEGSGQAAKSGDVVAVNYTGKFPDGKAFDSNVLPEFNHVEPFAFQLGAGMVIKGWDLGVDGMKPGEKRILEVSPEYAYGERGAGSVIPPNATLIFEVELISIVNN